MRTIQDGDDILSKVWYSASHHIIVNYRTVQCSVVQCSAVQCSLVEYDTIRQSTAQRGKAQHSTARHGTVDGIISYHLLVLTDEVECAERQEKRRGE
jgi:hypothetical protein